MRYILIVLLLLSSVLPQGKKDVQQDRRKAESRVIEYDVVPVPLAPIKPNYPEKDRMARRQGTVMVKVLVDRTGRVAETRVVQGIPGSGFDRAAEDAIKGIRFSPAQQSGKAVDAWVTIPVEFKLDNPDKNDIRKPKNP
ncbi:MAG: energy transducer TonB [Fidelibacterota bacterium]